MIKKRVEACSGFSMIELLIVMAVMSAMAAISLPSVQRTLRTYRILGDARGIAQTLTLAKMRSAANFTIEAVNWDPSNKSFSMKYFRKNPAQFEPDVSTQSLNLTTGVSLGLPASGPSTAVGANNTSGILFNSRGLPVDASFNPIDTPQALYFNNGTDYYAVSVAVTGRIQTWKYSDSTWVVQ